MGATPDYNRPGWNNPIDVDLDWIRNNFNFLLCMAATQSPILPGWATTVDVSSNNNYAKPDGYVLRKGTRFIYINMVWTDKTYTDESPNRTAPVLTQVTVGYDDGVSSPGLVWFDPVTLTAQSSAGYSTTAKHFGDGSSPSNYYQTGGGSSVSPQDWNGLIPAPGGSGDTYNQMTLVFCVYPVQLGDTDSWYIFGSESGNLIVGNWDLTGGVWLGARDWVNSSKSVNVTPVGSPSDYGGLIPGQWNTVMVAYNGATSPLSRNVEIWANGVEIFNGAWSTGSNGNNPMAYAGRCWVGRGDGFSGATDDGMNCYLSYVWCKEEYLDPNTYWSSFFDGSNKPLDIGADGSSVTGSPPDTYCPDADFTNNLGTGANWTEIGTVPAAPTSPTD